MLVQITRQRDTFPVFFFLKNWHLSQITKIKIYPFCLQRMEISKSNLKLILVLLNDKVDSFKEIMN
jgi:hypothetical protein